MSIETERPVQAEGEDRNLFYQRERQWERDTGRTCQKCRAYNVWPRGYPWTCHSCKELVTSSMEVDSSHFIRCPKCKNTWNPYECEDYQVFAEDRHEIQCSDCNHKFNVVTSISYSFKSPALIKEDQEEDDDD